jgi:rare lipoprotein A
MPDRWGLRLVARQCGEAVEAGGAGARRLVVWGSAALALAGCASSQPMRSAGFIPTSGAYDPKLGVRASDKVVADGTDVPKGGGTYLIGRPYVVAGRRYFPSDRPFSAVGIASWYGDAFQGRKTANGEIFDKRAVTAAHTTMPLPSYARVTNLLNARSIIVRVNDRGPYAAGRVMDVSERVAEALDFKNRGTARVKVEYIGRAALDGSQDDRLIASLRTDGTAASLDGSPDLGSGLFAQAPPAWPRAPDGEPPPDATQPAAAPTMQADASDAAAEDAGTTVAVGTPPPPARPFQLGTSKGPLRLTALAPHTRAGAPAPRTDEPATY